MTSVRTALVRGLMSGLLYEALVVVLSFASMIVLVRLLAPEEYGRAAAAVGILALIGAFRGAMFVEHALQCTKDEEPDWNTYFAVVGGVQIALCGVTLMVSFACLAFPSFASLSPLLQVGAIGLLIDWPAQVASVKLRRDLRMDRLKIISSIAMVLRMSSAIILAWAGFGAMALVISANVLAAVPMAVSFLLVEQWRPHRGWLFIPSRTELSPLLQFGGEQIAASLVQSLRTAADSVVLTSAFGVGTYGLLNRAQALYQSTIGRLGLVFIDAAYPLLPMERADPKRYAHRASRFVEAAFILSIPGAAFIVVEGGNVSRLLYGSKWTAADPYLAPGAVAVAAAGLVWSASAVVMGIGKVRAAMMLEACASIAAIAALGMALLIDTATPYAWTLAIAQIGAAGLAFWIAQPYLEADWMRRGLWPACAAAAGASAVVFLLQAVWTLDGSLGLAVTTSCFGLVAALILTITARPLVLEVVRTQKAWRWSGSSHAQAQA